MIVVASESESYRWIRAWDNVLRVWISGIIVNTLERSILGVCIKGDYPNSPFASLAFQADKALKISGLTACCAVVKTKNSKMEEKMSGKNCFCMVDGFND